MQTKLTRTLIKYEKIIPLALFLVFLATTLPGLSWGAPDLWNPDELFWRVNKALVGEMQFDTTEPDYNYPSLPKYMMYGVGWLVQEAGGSPTDVLVSARLLSVLLGGLSVLLIYFMARLASENIYVRLLAAFLALSNTAMAHNARFAHNDMYLLFFLTLALYAILRYRLSRNRLWLYLAFFSTGCAASSKYTGATFVVLLVILFVWTEWKHFRIDWLRSIETFFIVTVLTAGGFVLGTPKALLWMSFYFKRMIPAALRFASYGRGPDSLVGLYGQWGTFRQAVGTAVYYFFLIAFLWFSSRLILSALNKISLEAKRRTVICTLLVAIIIFDIPFTMSYNYVPRFFLPFLPMFAVLGALFVEDVYLLFRDRGYVLAGPVIGAAVVLVLVVSFLNVVSVALLFANDARTAAGAYIRTLQAGTHIEYTLYPPAISGDQFEIARNYPIYLIKYPGETVPTNKPYRYNEGEDGLYERGADYLVIDSFTYARFSDEHVCETNPVECDFFTRLLAGETDLRLLATFEYSLPPFLPQISLAAVNPVVKVYEVPY